MCTNVVYSYINEIALRLKEPRKYGSISLMVGAGFSKNANNKGGEDSVPPNWTELADKMYCELYPKLKDMGVKELKDWENQKLIKTSGRNVTKLAEEYIVNFDRNRINDLIEEVIADNSFTPGEIHKKLLCLPWGDIFTTNYDTLLERTSDLIFREVNYEIVYSQNDLPGSIKPRIIKLHGSIPQVKPYIISDEDYRTYPIKYSAMVNTVQQSMLESRLCLIGFSGDDPNFQSWLGWLRDNMGENCPKIYLIGIYDDLCISEKKLLENKQITVVDISCLVDKNEENRYSKAISKFLDVVGELQKETDICAEQPYRDEIWKHDWKPENIEQYLENVNEYAEKVWEQIKPYVLIPQGQRKNLETYFKYHFEFIVKEYADFPITNIVANIIKILRKCLVPLMDFEANCLENIIQSCEKSEYKNIKKCDLIEIVLYLLEMYRIDGKYDDYNRNLNLAERYVSSESKYLNSIRIEKVKIKIETFELDEAKKLIKEIEDNDIETRIKKAGLYKQMSDLDSANKILNSCSADLAQMKISDNIYASYISYLKLCHSVYSWDFEDKYKEIKYSNNKYNVRCILLDIINDLKDRIFKKEFLDEQKPFPFNLNTNNGKTYTIGNDNLFEKSFTFILIIDRLCLPLFSEQISLVPSALKKIIYSSDCSYWKLSFAVRTNNEKVIEQIFTRENIASLNKRDIKKLYDSMVSIAKKYSKEDSFRKARLFISLENLIDVLSRLVLFLEDENVTIFIELITTFSKIEDMPINVNMYRILDRIRTRFNNDIFEKIQKTILLDFNEKYCITGYYIDYKLNIDKNFVDNYYRHAINLTESSNIEKRDCGILQLLLLWTNCREYKYETKIKNAIWNNVTNNIPETKIINPILFDKLPHDKLINANYLGYNYFKNYKFIPALINGSYKYNESINNVYYFLQSFKIWVFNNKKINVDINLSKSVILKIVKLINRDKRILKRKYETIGEIQQTKDKFGFLSDIIALLYINAYVNGFYDALAQDIDMIKRWYNTNSLNCESINMVDYIRQNKYSKCINFFENTILSKNKDVYDRAFIGIKCLFIYLESKNIKDNDVDASFKRLLDSLKYLDIEYVKTVWGKMEDLLVCEFFIDYDKQKYIAESINKCINLYTRPAEKGERYYLDGLYNCTLTIRKYYDFISSKNIEISDELEECVSLTKKIDNLEITNIWNIEIINN